MDAFLGVGVPFMLYRPLKNQPVVPCILLLEQPDSYRDEFDANEPGNFVAIPTLVVFNPFTAREYYGRIGLVLRSVTMVVQGQGVCLHHTITIQARVSDTYPKAVLDAARICGLAGVCFEAMLNNVKPFNQGPLNRGGSNGGASQSRLARPDLSFFVPFGTFPMVFGIFPICPGIFPVCPFPLSWPTNSAYEEQSRKGPRHNLDLSRKK